MTATDELHRLLDGRGVEWVAIGTDTCWTGADGYPMRAWETTNGTHMRVADLTPEQAIEATLGSDLKAENEQLRRERDMYRDLVGMMDHPDLNVQLSAENAKLRELVRDLYQCSRQCGCDRCGYKDGCAMFDHMRELGIEADA